ncbi:HEAT repeat domain-containing protein [Thermogemmatispora sp.]|uniref:HEAT repeat domain-containing protein n=1 Tax=Thermogemmatispora sp. TaxID=1968838 RepID=UPI0035E42867
MSEDDTAHDPSDAATGKAPEEAQKTSRQEREVTQRRLCPLPADGEALVSELKTALERQLLLPSGPLLLALAHSSWNVRAEAVRLLGLSREPMIELLLSTLGQEAHEGVREAIVWSLGRLIPALLADEQLRRTWLVHVRTTLIALLQADDCWLVREAAAWALGRLGWATPLEALRQALLSDSDEEVCAAAAQALAASGRRLARAYLLEALEKVEMPFLQETIREALAELDEVLARKEVQAQRPGSPLRQTLLALRDFLEDRRGSLLEPRLLVTGQEPVLVLWCIYQAKERRLKEVLDGLPQDLWARALIAPLEATQRSNDRVLRLLGQRLVQYCQQPSCQEVLMLSTTICRQARTESLLTERGRTCLRVIIIGVSASEVDLNKPPVLRELALAWKATTQEAPLCEQDPCDLRLWYQPCPSWAGQS